MSDGVDILQTAQPRSIWSPTATELFLASVHERRSIEFQTLALDSTVPLSFESSSQVSFPTSADLVGTGFPHPSSFVAAKSTIIHTTSSTKPDLSSSKRAYDSQPFPLPAPEVQMSPSSRLKQKSSLSTFTPSLSNGFETLSSNRPTPNASVWRPHSSISSLPSSDLFGLSCTFIGCRRTFHQRHEYK